MAYEIKEISLIEENLEYWERSLKTCLENKLDYSSLDQILFLYVSLYLYIL